VAISNWTYLPEYAELGPELLEAVREVFESGRLILGSRVREFEQRFASWVGAEQGIGVNSGTDAIFLGLKALGVGPGDEVVTVANTAVPTVAAIRATGANAILVDIEPDTYLMDVGQVEAALTPRVKALLPVHLYGQAVDLDPLLDLARHHGLSLLEDCAQSHGCCYKGRMTGSIGDVGAFSFYPTKVLGAYGDGGLCTTNSGELAERLRMLRFYGMQTQYYSEIEGFNSRLDEVQAAILLVKLKRIDAALAERRRLAALYDEELADLPLRLPVRRPESTHSFFLYVVRSPRRDELIGALAAAGIEARIHFPFPIHQMRGYEFLGYRPGDLPHSELAAREIMSLPMYPGLTDEQVGQVAAVLRSALR
jgi:dTDP-3-amino-2,3,6-trideoxy-4-keto-D-glucose/dTDP-3-amino-3,4,6-trideoxy-alpha-D-glucose/dTDP-2,6-dideoxy-D-kanosamine transaminase